MYIGSSPTGASCPIKSTSFSRAPTIISSFASPLSLDAQFYKKNI
jgi:hypothetical protein